MTPSPAFPRSSAYRLLRLKPSRAPSPARLFSCPPSAHRSTNSTCSTTRASSSERSPKPASRWHFYGRLSSWENAAWDVAAARAGRIESYLQPLDRGIDMGRGTRDIGRLAAGLLREQWTGARIVELSGPSKVSPLDITSGFAASALGHPVDVVTVLRQTWEQRFRGEGMHHPQARSGC